MPGALDNDGILAAGDRLKRFKDLVLQLLFLRLKDIFFRIAVAHGDGAHVLDMFLAMINLPDQIGVFINGLFFIGDGFLADGFHKGGLDLALLEILEQPQGQGRLAGVLMDGGDKNILKVFGFFHRSPAIPLFYL